MGNVKDYDPKKVVCSWTPKDNPYGTILLNEGVAEGTMIQVSRSKRTFAKSIGGDGEGTRIKSNDFSGTVTVTVRNGSELNDKLSTILGGAETTGLGNLGPLGVEDFSGRSLATAPEAYLEGWPDKSYSSESEDNMDWVLIAHNLRVFHGGNKDAA